MMKRLIGTFLLLSSSVFTSALANDTKVFHACFSGRIKLIEVEINYQQDPSFPGGGVFLDKINVLESGRSFLSRSKYSARYGKDRSKILGYTVQWYDSEGDKTILDIYYDTESRLAGGFLRIPSSDFTKPPSEWSLECVTESR